MADAVASSSSGGAGWFLLGGLLGGLFGAGAVYMALSDTAPRLPRFGTQPGAPRSKGPGHYVVAFKDPKRRGEPASRRRIGYVDGPYPTRDQAAAATAKVPGYWYDPVPRYLSASAASRMFQT